MIHLALCLVPHLALYLVLHFVLRLALIHLAFRTAVHLALAHLAHLALLSLHTLLRFALCRYMLPQSVVRSHVTCAGPTHVFVRHAFLPGTLLLVAPQAFDVLVSRSTVLASFAVKALCGGSLQFLALLDKLDDASPKLKT